MVQVDPEAIDMQPLQVLSTWDGSRLVLAITGQLDLLTGDPMVRSVSDLLSAGNGGRPEIELDLSELVFVDVAGYRALLRIHDEVVTQRAGSVRVSNPGKRVWWFFELLGACGHTVPFDTE